MPAPEVSAYPYARWPRVSRAQALGLRRLLRALTPRRLRGARAEAEALLGVALQVAPLLPENLPQAAAQAELRDPLTAVWLELLSGARAFPVLCELAPELAAELADRILGGDGRPGHPLGEPLDETSAGVLGYLAARLAPALGGGLRARAVLLEAARARAILDEMNGRVTVLPVALELGGEARGRLRLFFTEPLAAQLAPEPSPCGLSPALRALPLSLCAHAGRARLSRGELAALGRGDVVVPNRCGLVREADGFRGQVFLHAIGSARGGFACSASGRALRIERVRFSGDSAMTQSKRIHTEALEPVERTPGVAADAPIELCLELARFTLPLEEVSALRAGEVLSTGKPIGERVTLSAHGRVLARGELVDVDGEVGVRITELS